MERANTTYTVCSKCQRAACESCFNDRTGLCQACVGQEAGGAPAGLGSGRHGAARGGGEEPRSGGSQAAGMACPNCRSSHGGGRFCAECGFDLASTHKSCPECGAMALRQTRFCNDCGHGF